MPFAPDYGHKLMTAGVSSDIDLAFSEIPLLSVDVVAPGQFCTTVNILLSGKEHAVTFDFDAQVLEQILLRLANEGIANEIRKALGSAPVPSSIELRSALSLRATARLGTVQRSAKETFVPLVIKKIEAATLKHSGEKTVLRRQVFDAPGVDQIYGRLGFLPAELSMQIKVGGVTLTAAPHAKKGAIIVFDLTTPRSTCRFDVSLPLLCSPEQIAELIQVNLSLNFPHEMRLWEEHMRKLNPPFFNWGPLKNPTS